MIRNYPVRTSRKRWKIHIHSTHVCTPRCRYRVAAVATAEGSFMHIIDNPHYVDGHCHLSNSLVNSVVRLATYQKRNALCSSGVIHRPDDIVVPDTSIKIVINYPLLHGTEVAITSSNPRGFSLRELIHHVKRSYTYIYAEEERTATRTTFNLSKRCESCVSSASQTSPVVVEETQDCSICCDTMDDTMDCVSVPCGHLFHKSCIEEWLQCSRNCPLCRKATFSCSECGDRGIVFYDYDGVVVPRSERGLHIERNQTNGRFGILECDFTDLFLYGMMYDRDTKSLTLSMNSILIYPPASAT